MPKTAFKRARKPAEKEARRSAILNAAGELLDSEGLRNVSLSGIAKRAGLAKSNLYRYFGSREEIFLTLLHDAELKWVEDVETELSAIAGCDDPDAVGQILARTAVRYPRLCELGASMASVLEQNLNEESVLSFKQGTYKLSLRIGNAVYAALPSFPLEDGARMVRYLYSAVAGLWPSSHPAPTVAKVMALPEMEPFRCDFAKELERMSVAILRGMVVRPPA